MHQINARCFARADGFTLVELMVTVLVVAILFGIAVPTYTSQTQKARRTDARSALLDLAGREERFLSVATSYSQTPTNLGYAGASFPQQVGSYYQINVTVTAGVPPTPPSFLITATPTSTQVNDSTCAKFTVDQIGQHKSNDVNNVDTSATCWAGT